VFRFTCLISSFPFDFLESAANKAPPILKSSQFYGRHHDLVDRYGISVTNDHGYVPLVVSTSWSFPRSWLITGFVTRLTRHVSLMEQELLTLPEHLGSPPVFSGVCVTRSLFLYACFVDLCLSFCTFSFAHCFVCFSSIYGFWLPLWYLQTLLITDFKNMSKLV
jgi:hypothetical protein